MNSDRCNVSHRFHIPNLAKQFCLGKYTIWIFCKKGKKIKFLGCKCFLLTIYPYSSGSLVNLDSTNLYNIILCHVGAYKSVISFHMGLYSCNQLTWAEWFRHIVICPKSQPPDFINIIFLRRNHNDRNILFLTYLTADIKSVNFRKHKIKNDQIILFLQGLFQAHITSCRNLDLKSG